MHLGLLLSRLNTNEDCRHSLTKYIYVARTFTPWFLSALSGIQIKQINSVSMLDKKKTLIVNSQQLSNYQLNNFLHDSNHTIIVGPITIQTREIKSKVVNINSKYLDLWPILLL